MAEDNKNSFEDAFSIDAILKENERLKEKESNTVLSNGDDEINKFATKTHDIGKIKEEKRRLDESELKKSVADDAADEKKQPDKKSSPDEQGKDGDKNDSKEKNNKKSRKKKKKRRRSVIWTLVWILIIIILSLAISGAIITVCSDVLGIGKDKVFSVIRGDNRELYTENGDVVIVQMKIEEGENLTEIAQRLDEKGIILDSRLFRAYIKIKSIDAANINYGFHDFSAGMGYDEILNELGETAKAEDLKVTIPSGKTVDEIAEILEKNKVCKADSFKNAAKNGSYKSELLSVVPDNKDIYYKVEGYLYPDTYSFYENDDPERIIQKMLNNMEKKFGKKLREKAKKKGCTTHEILSLASVVEMECCGYDDQMTKVSAVFWNRLDNWGAGQRFLQSDPTMNYKYGNGAYNTYKVEGIPIAPMCSVTINAIKAAITPDSGSKDLYFFVTDKNSQFYYSATNSEHLSIISSLREQGLWQ